MTIKDKIYLFSMSASLLLLLLQIIVAIAIVTAPIITVDMMFILGFMGIYNLFSLIIDSKIERKNDL